MVPCFPLSFDPRNQPKLSAFLKPFRFRCHHGPFFSSPSPLPFDDDGGAAEDSDLNNHHVIILEIRQRAMMKARSESRSSFVIMTAEDLGRLIKAAAPPPTANKFDDAEEGEKKDGDCEGDDENEEEFFSVRSCFSRCSGGEEEYCLSRKTAAAAAVKLSEDWFRECEGWPFGLWRRRRVVVLPPLPKSPADSWTWHKRNMGNVKVEPVWAASLKQL